MSRSEALRPTFAVLLAIVFSALFVFALLVSRVVNTAGDPGEVAGLIEEADLYDFVYDRLLDAALSDVTTRGLSVETGLDGSKTIQFDDPAQAQAAIKSFIETVFPREYVQLKVEEALQGVIPYASGRSDGFEIDLETEQRIDALPEAVRTAARRIGLGDIVLTGLVVPTVRDLSGSITNEALGIELTPGEAEDAALRILPPEWIETRVFSFADQAAPYFAGTEDNLDIVITFTDRVPVTGQVLKDKLNDEDTLVRLVFDQVVDPLVGQFAEDSATLVFGIEITKADIQEAVEIVAPAAWVREQGDGIIDAFVAWLVGATETLEYTFDLSERKTDATVQLEELAFRKLDERVTATPVCQSPAQTVGALNDALQGVFPSCLTANASELLNVMRPLVSGAIVNLISNSLPDQITYSERDFRAQLGPGSLDTLDSLRDLVINGFTFTDDDLVEMIAGDNADAQALADARENLDIARAGFVFNETEFTDRMDADQLTEFNSVRDRISLGWTFRWFIFAPAVLLLIGVSIIGGRGWQGRLKWAGAPVAVVSILFFAAIQIGWASTVVIRESSFPTVSLSEQNRADYPALAAIIDGDELQNMFERVGSAWMSGLAISAVPWAVAGLLLFGLGLPYPKYRQRLHESLDGPRGSRLRPASSADPSVGQLEPADAGGEPLAGGGSEESGSGASQPGTAA